MIGDFPVSRDALERKFVFALFLRGRQSRVDHRVCAVVLWVLPPSILTTDPREDFGTHIRARSPCGYPKA